MTSDRYYSRSLAVKNAGGMRLWLVDQLVKLSVDNSTVSELDLSNIVAMDDVYISRLTKILMRNTTLKWLDLSHCCLNERNLSDIANALKVNRTLKVLNIASI